MDERNAGKPERLVRYSPRASGEIASIHTSTAQRHGYDQAERYSELIRETARTVALHHPSFSKPVEGREGFFVRLVRWKNAKDGHYLVYQPTEYGAYVVCVLHSKMDLPNQLSEE